MVGSVLTSIACGGMSAFKVPYSATIAEIFARYVSGRIALKITPDLALRTTTGTIESIKPSTGTIENSSENTLAALSIPVKLPCP